MQRKKWILFPKPAYAVFNVELQASYIYIFV